MPAREGRDNLHPREITLTPNYMKSAEGSCLVEFGDTKVICTASVEEKVPPFLESSNLGWVTAEYSMLPRSTNSRTDRRRRLGPKGRTHEIERLIGRSLRQAVDLRHIGARTIILDCDVMGADGGTRTASVTGAWVALHQALVWLNRKDRLKRMPKVTPVAAISVGIVDGEVRVDLNYKEDSKAEVDLNVVMQPDGEIIEVQGTGERKGFTRVELERMLDGAEAAIPAIFDLQLSAVS